MEAKDPTVLTVCREALLDAKAALLGTSTATEQTLSNIDVALRSLETGEVPPWPDKSAFWMDGFSKGFVDGYDKSLDELSALVGPVPRPLPGEQATKGLALVMLATEAFARRGDDAEKIQDNPIGEAKARVSEHLE